jgi:hypothetical protein
MTRRRAVTGAAQRQAYQWLLGFLFGHADEPPDAAPDAGQGDVVLPVDGPDAPNAASGDGHVTREDGTPSTP